MQTRSAAAGTTGAGTAGTTGAGTANDSDNDSDSTTDWQPGENDESSCNEEGDNDEDPDCQIVSSDVEVATGSRRRGRPAQPRAVDVPKPAFPPPLGYAGVLTNSVTTEAHDNVVFQYLTCSDLAMNVMKTHAIRLPRGVFFNVGGTTLTSAEGAVLRKSREWLTDNIIMAYSKAVEFRNDLLHGGKKVAVIMDPQYSTMVENPNRGDTNHKTVARWIAAHITADTKAIFFPANIPRVHFFSVIVDLVNYVVYAIETKRGNDHTPSLLLYKGLLVNHWNIIRPGVSPPKWTIKMITPPVAPLQSDGCNCGVFVCAIMDLYTMGIPINSLASLVNHRNIGDIRRRIATFMDGFNDL